MRSAAGNPRFHFDLQIGSRGRPIEDLRRDVGADDLDAPIAQSRFEQRHCHAVQLLSRGARRGPDAQSLGRGPGFHQLRNQLLAKRVEDRRVAEEQGLVGGHALHNPAAQRLGRGLPQPIAQLVERRQVLFRQHGLQPRFQQVEFVGAEFDTRFAMPVGP